MAKAKFTIVADAVNFEPILDYDSTPLNKNGSYSRIPAIKKLIDYLNNNSNMGNVTNMDQLFKKINYCKRQLTKPVLYTSSQCVKDAMRNGRTTYEAILAAQRN